MASANPSARANPALVEVKLRALARSARGVELTFVDPSVGAGLADGVAFYLADDEPRAVGRALHWALSRHATRLELLASEVIAGDLARRASLLSDQPDPSIGVWAVHGAQAVPAQPAPVRPPPTLPASHWALAGLMTEAGALPVDDNGQLVAEVAGLEVARVAHEGPDNSPTIEVGVGKADRELSVLVHSHDDIDTGLRRVVAAVVKHRSGHGDNHHPLARLARERWLRSILLDQPELIDAVALAPMVPLRPRLGLVRNEPSVAVGRLRSGQPVVAVTMVGVDLDLIPEAADYRAHWDPAASVVLVMPERDLTLSTRLLDRLPSSRALAIPVPWN